MADDSQDERYYKKGYAIRKLSHENHRTWFAEIDLKFNAKGVKWAVDASVATPGPPILTPAQSLSSSAAPEEPWNNAYTKNSTAYPKADAEARLIILKYLNEEDKEIMVMVPSSGENARTAPSEVLKGIRKHKPRPSCRIHELCEACGQVHRQRMGQDL
ncbi:MAG: hypothetical protein L6R37_008384 [Teloschistes peruensis]|nr:MAG: hypothetical protein L6R37_008384 [Teloschistes peruensis]